MLKVAGSNLFGQWLEKESIFDSFTTIKNEIINKAKIECIQWAYSLFQIDANFYISGAFREKESQFVKLNLSHKNYLVSGNDYQLIFINKELNIIEIFDFKTEQSKILKLVECLGEEECESNEITKVVATNNSCLYLTTKGLVYCGLLPNLVNTTQVVGNVIDVALGFEHCLLLTDVGRVYTWGNGRRLQLGHGDLNNLEYPTEVQALAGIKITKISAGGWHSCAISEYGDLYVWGWNDTGQLGVRDKINADNSIDLQSHGLPILVDIYDSNSKAVEFNVEDVACGNRHTAILLEDGTVWTSGCNKYGQLGFPTTNVTKIESFSKSYVGANSLLCGPWNTVIKC